ncbi:MAG: hypothetical protein E7539_06335 [Ruminococcaceae bacterium]|nr:hypothetical protein [Oscillospiraceae bacterium]
MKHTKLKRLADKWEQMTHTVLALKEIHIPKLQGLLKETYSALVAFHNDELVPKEISKVFLEMEDFLYFAFLMEEKEVNTDYYCYRKVHAVVKALEKSFFCGDYGCDFPKLKIADDNKTPFIFDFETNLLGDIMI